VSLSELGRDTLFVYGFGNILINLLPIYRGEDPLGLLFVLLFLGSLIVLTMVRDRLFRVLDRLTMGSASLFMRHYRAVHAHAVDSMMTRLPAVSTAPLEGRPG
jgi:hypothetical protein